MAILASAIPKARAVQLKKNLEAKIKRQYELYDKLPPYIPPANPRTSTCGKGGEDDMLADSVLNFDQLYEVSTCHSQQMSFNKP